MGLCQFKRIDPPISRFFCRYSADITVNNYTTLIYTSNGKKLTLRHDLTYKKIKKKSSYIIGYKCHLRILIKGAMSTESFSEKLTTL